MKTMKSIATIRSWVITIRSHKSS